MLPLFQLPTPSGEPTDRSYPSWRKWWMSYTDLAFNYLSNWITQQLSVQFNTLLNGYGPDIVSSGTVTVTNMLHQVTGIVTINTINAPVNIAGPLVLYARDGFNITTFGNITPAKAVLAGHAAFLAYHPVLGKWVGE